MSTTKRPINRHKAYHAHVYFDDKTLGFATSFCNNIDEVFDVKLGRVHQKLLGPHTKWSCQISFSNNTFEALVEWMEQNRNGLSVLIHAVSGNDLQDHTEFAYWLGDPVDLDLSIFE